MLEIFQPVACVGIWTGIIIVIATGPYPEVCELSKDMTTTHKMLGAFVSFFLIFKTNQAYIRYWRCNATLKLVQITTRDLHQQFLIYLKGGRSFKNKDEAKFELMEKRAVQARIDATRYIMAYCVAFKLHSRIAYDGYEEGDIDAEKKQQVDFDRARLRGLLSAEEFAIVNNVMLLCDEPLIDGKAYPVGQEVAIRACHVVEFFLRSLCARVSRACEHWGWFERCLNLVDNGIAGLVRAFEEMDQNITTPLPLPYCHLCRWLMAIYFLTYPFACSKPSEGIAVNVFTASVIAVAMFGIEAISMEIEDPYGDDHNDFDVMRIISAIEDSLYEAMVLQGGVDHDRGHEVSHFTWIRAPAEYLGCNHFLAIHSEVDAVLQMMPTASIRESSVKHSPVRAAVEATDIKAKQNMQETGPRRYKTILQIANSDGHQKKALMNLSADDKLCPWRPT